MFAAGKTAGAAGAVAANYIEDVFSTYLYTGNGSTQTITNGIDLAGEGGLIWTKSRNNAISNINVDTVRGGINALITNSTAANSADTGFHISSFNSNGYSLQGAGSGDNASGYTYASWTFRKQPKFFDVVTYTGTGAVQNIAHNLGSVPGCVITKKTSAASNWAVYHRGITSSETGAILLNTTATFVTSAAVWDSTAPTSTQFTVGTADATNISGQTYVAYLFAHDAGGFGLTGTDNVISCGTYNGNSTTNSINLGYEPQWLLIKRTTVAASDWVLLDNMRGLTVGTSDAALCPNNSNAEGATVSVSNAIRPTATGFDLLNSNSALNVSGSSYIYIAIRRGPMAVPTLGTSVYAGQLQSPPGGSYTLAANSGFPIDMLISRVTASIQSCYTLTRLQGNEYLATASTAAAGSATYGWDKMAGVTATWDSSAGTVSWAFRRAPGVMDVVCYTGTGVARTVAHNLGVAPELWIIKGRSGATAWQVGLTALANTEYVVLNTTAAKATGATRWNSTYPTSSVFSLGTATEVNTSAATYVAYLFATCAGVSKVGSYTGTGALQTVACGFTSGARFVLIKRTDSTGDWYVWDSARGITSGNDPYLLLNSTAAGVTATNYVDTDTTGFKVTAAAPAGLNASGGTYIFLAIA